MRTRRVLVILGLTACVAVGGYLAARSPWVRDWFAKDAVDDREVAKASDAALAVTGAADAATGWPQWRGPLRDGRAPAGPFRTDWDKAPPQRLWQTPCGGGYSSLAVVGNSVYTQDRQKDRERVLCLNAADGAVQWEYAYPAEAAGHDAQYSGGPRATPTVLNNTLFAVGGAGKFLCLNLSPDGRAPTLRWEHDLLGEFKSALAQWGVACSPLVEGDLAIVQPGGKDGSVVAFDVTTGAVRWRCGDEPSGYSSPVAATVGGERLFLALTARSLLAITRDGAIADRFAWVTSFDGNIATPLVVDDYVFVSAAYGRGCALLRLERSGGSVKFVQVYTRHKGMQNHHASSVYRDRFLYGFDGESSAQLRCVEFATGIAKPNWDSRDVGKGSLILADRHLIVQTERGDLCLVEATPEEFRLVAKVSKVLSGRNNWAAPALVDGRLYLRDDENVVCYDVRP